VKDPLEDFATV